MCWKIYRSFHWGRETSLEQVALICFQSIGVYIIYGSAIWLSNSTLENGIQKSFDLKPRRNLSRVSLKWLEISEEVL